MSKLSIILQLCNDNLVYQMYFWALSGHSFDDYPAQIGTVGKYVNISASGVPHNERFPVYSSTCALALSHLCLDSVGSWACPFLVKLCPPLGQQVVLHCFH